MSAILTDLFELRLKAPSRRVEDDYFVLTFDGSCRLKKGDIIKMVDTNSKARVTCTLYLSTDVLVGVRVL